MDSFNILIVCTGNSCRSPMAQGLLDRMLHEARVESVTVRSAGISTGGGSPASEGSLLACREVEVDLSDHRSTRLTTDETSWADLILCMEQHHKGMVLDLDPGAGIKTHLLGEYDSRRERPEILDPVGLPLPYYRACRDELFDCLRGVLISLDLVRTDRKKDGVFLK